MQLFPGFMKLTFSNYLEVQLHLHYSLQFISILHICHVIVMPGTSLSLPFIVIFASAFYFVFFQL